MFTDPKALAQGTMDAHVTDASSAITAMRSLNVLYKALLVSVRDEAVIMEQVFPAADAALARLITRVFEQRVQVGAHTLLRVSDGLMAGGSGISDPCKQSRGSLVIRLFEKRGQVAPSCVSMPVYLFGRFCGLCLFLPVTTVTGVLLCLLFLLPGPTRPHAAGNTSKLPVTCLFCAAALRGLHGSL